MNILFFGDSLTAGYGLNNTSSESFPGLIQQKIHAEQLDYQIINAGLSGDTSSGGLSRIDYWISQPIHIFVLELGVNDIIRGISPAVTKKNLQIIIDKVKNKYPIVKMALMGMEIPAFIPGPYGEQFRGIFRQLADANKMAFVPFFLEGVAGHAHLNLKDGLHPSAAGYRIIADTVWPTIRKLL
jgi:acyl-CoA thioesterase-1